MTERTLTKKRYTIAMQKPRASYCQKKQRRHWFFRGGGTFRQGTMLLYDKAYDSYNLAPMCNLHRVWLVLCMDKRAFINFLFFLYSDRGNKQREERREREREKKNTLTLAPRLAQRFDKLCTTRQDNSRSRHKWCICRQNCNLENCSYIIAVIESIRYLENR